MAEEAATEMAALSVEGEGESKAAKAAAARAADRAAKAEWYAKRIAFFEGFKAREDAKVQAAKDAEVPFTVVLPDGNEVAAVRGSTTPMDIALGISKGLAKKCVVASADGQPWDLKRPLGVASHGDKVSLKLHTFDDAEGKETFWHSTSHILGEVLEAEYGVDLTIGPAIAEGFYYDCYMGDRVLTEADHVPIKATMEKAVKDKQEYQRIEVSREECLSMFQENKFKVEILNGLPEDAIISVYRVGPMVDLCSGPHIPSTEMIKALDVTQCSRAHWRADVKREPLMRVYAVAYPEAKLLREYQHRIAEAKKRDHRVLGVKHNLFFFNGLSPGSCFWMPAGARIYQALVSFIREKYWDYEYDEVITPNIYNFDLWHTSGHAAHYRENMFGFSVENQDFGLKPMNCPGHCVMFRERRRTYRELPMRLADFGVLHRNEFSGALQGLTRVRRFQQDDAHIFCRPDQMEHELTSFLKFLDEVYGVFGLDYEMALSTRPDDFMGEIELWDQAESALRTVLDATGREWYLNEGDGAFYGPKIDITVFDALKRKFQCATVQLDFQLPQRFDLKYTTEDGTARPIIIHRAILGSVERMSAILVEHFASKFPLWLSPRQVMVVPISEKNAEYAKEVRAILRRAKLFVDVDLSANTMQKKVREAQLSQYNYILVVGKQEEVEGTVNVRTRDNKVHGMHKVRKLAELLAFEREQRLKGSIMDGLKVADQAESNKAAAAAAGGGDDAAKAGKGKGGGKKEGKQKGGGGKGGKGGKEKKDGGKETATKEAAPAKEAAAAAADA